MVIKLYGGIEGLVGKRINGSSWCCGCSLGKDHFAQRRSRKINLQRRNCVGIIVGIRVAKGVYIHYMDQVLERHLGDAVGERGISRWNDEQRVGDCEVVMVRGSVAGTHACLPCQQASATRL